MAALALAAGGLGLLAAAPAGAAPKVLTQAAKSVSSSAPTLKLSITVGPPSTVTKANGSGYSADDAVTITFDTTTVATTTSSSTGTFAAPFTVPASATPGPHTVSAFDGAGLGASATFTLQTNWASPRFAPAGTGFNPYENVLSPANVGRLTLAAEPQWGAYLHSEGIYYFFRHGGTDHSLIVAGSSDGTVRAFDPTGDQHWSFTTGGAVDGSPTAVIRKAGEAPCAVVAGSGDGNLYGIDPSLGTELWKLNMGGPISGSPVPVGSGTLQLGGNVVVVSDGGTITLMNGCTGGVVWTGTLKLGSAPPQAETAAVLNNVTIGDGSVHTVIVVITSGGTFALDAGSGTVLWTGVAACANPPCTPLTYGSGTLARVVVGSGDPTAVELNAGTGQQIWSTQLPAPVSGLGLYEVPVAGSTTKFSVQSIIVGDTAGDLDALKPKTGAINWGDKDSGPMGEPATANGVIYDTVGPTASTDGQLIALDGSGRVLFSADTADLNPQPYPPAPPTIADGRVYVGDFTGGMRSFSLPAG